MKLYLKIVGAVFLFDLLFYPVLYFVLLPKTDTLAGNWAILGIRVAVCCAIGFWFGRRSQAAKAEAAGVKNALLIAAAALFFWILLFIWESHLTDFVWYGVITEDFDPFAHPVRLFFFENLFERFAVSSYTCLVITFQMGRLGSHPKEALD